MLRSSVDDAAVLCGRPSIEAPKGLVALTLAITTLGLGRRAAAFESSNRYSRITGGSKRLQRIGHDPGSNDE